MNPLHAAILGALQGLTEILPISSSAHLILVPRLFAWPESGLTFDVALHVGTMLALCIYFWRDILELTDSFFRYLGNREAASQADRLPLHIIVATVPAAVAGKTLEGPIEELFRHSPAIIALLLIGFGLILAIAEYRGARRYDLGRITMGAAIAIGLAQCLALIPGVSRSGITITAALLLGFRRDAATRFSFLLSLPIVAGAGLLKLGHLARHGIPAGETGPLLIGIATSALFGYLSIAFLLRYVQSRTFSPFVWYRLLAGAGVLVWLYLAGGGPA